MQKKNDEQWFDILVEQMKTERFTVEFETLRESIPLRSVEPNTPDRTLRIGHTWNECRVCHETDTEIRPGNTKPGLVIVMDDPERAIQELTEYRDRYV